MAEEKINPIRLKYEDGTVYTLEFSAKTVKEAEGAGFVIQDVLKKPMTLIPLLFFYSFRMHHPTISKKKTDSILEDDLGGLSESMQERLIELYFAPMEGLGGGESPKNPTMAVEM